MSRLTKSSSVDQEDIKDGAILGGAALTVPRLANAGLERVLGVQRFVHGTSDDSVKGILAQGLRADLGGAAHGSSAATGEPSFVNESKGKVHVAKDNTLGRNFVAKMHGLIAQEASARGGDVPGRDIYNKLFYADSRKEFVRSAIKAFFMRKPTVGGAMPYAQFSDVFEQDPDHVKGLAYRTTQNIDSSNLRKSRAGLSQILNSAKSVDFPKYLKANAGRAGRGVTLLAAAAGLGNAAVNSATDIFDRKTKDKTP